MLFRPLLCLVAATTSAMPVPGFVEKAVDGVKSTFGFGEFKGDTTCSGAGDPPAVPACYSGKASILGGAISEAVVVDLKTYGSKAGTMDVHAKGALKEDCDGLKFTKSGQTITFDSSCLHAKIEAVYCSDQDEVHLSVPVKGLPTVKTALTKTTCA